MPRAGSRKWWALGAITLAVLAAGLDSTILSVALPTLAGSLKATESDLQWFQSAYLLVLAAAMLPAGLIGDRLGRKKTMLVSLALFGLGSAACAYSRTPAEFITARAVLGLAGAGVIVMALSAVTVLFAPEERPRAVGIWTAANFLALPAGPILGGWLLTHYWWGWVFLINVPVALIGLLASLVLLPESTGAAAEGRLDWLGMVSSTAGLAVITYGLVEAGEKGWSNAVAWSCIVVGLLVMVGFFLWEHRLERSGSRIAPVVDLVLFRSRSFTWGVVLSAVALLAMIGMLFTMPQYFQGVQGADALHSGLRLLPVIGGLVVGAVSADRIAKLIGPKLTVALGFVILGIGTGLGATTQVYSGTAFVATWMAIGGAGMGVALSTAASTALSELSEERSGIGSAVMQALQKLGAPFGAAILGSVLSSAYRSDLSLGDLPADAAKAAESSVFGGLAVAQKLGSADLADEVRSAFVHGVDVALYASVGIAAVGLILTLIFLPGRTRLAEGGAPQEAARGLTV